jgi:hypothetical protein
MRGVSSSNLIYHNNLIDNGVNGVDENNNQWDNGYPSGGNYWSDYTGDDLNGDGIGDTPKIISEGEDRYPLMTPHGPPHANFTYDINSDNQVSFNGSFSYDYDGTIVSYDWEFGDGSFGTGLLISHTYGNNRDYIVNLTVTDDDGKQDTISKIITINNPLTFTNPSPVNGSINTLLNLTWQIMMNDSEGDLFNWSISCSNGQTNSGDGAVNGTKSLNLTNLLYNTLYYVYVNATDPDGSGRFVREWFIFTTKPSQPPIFGSPTPENGSINQPLSLTWNIPVNDPEGDTIDWAIHCSNGQTNSGTGETNGTKSLSLYDLSPSTIYTVWVNATDPLGSTLYTRHWYTFTTRDNTPPYIPNSPSPANGTTEISLYPTLSWSGGDPDGDTVTYDVYFGSSSSPPMVSANQSGTVYSPGSLSYGTTYYWRIVAWDIFDAVSIGPLWEFTTKINNPPYAPFNPIPENESTLVDINQNLGWECGDPDGHSITYDVYYGTTTPPPKVADDITIPIYELEPLEYSTLYYWKIVAEDAYGAITEGPIWHFTTMQLPVPDLDCTGSLSWSQVPAGSTQQGTFSLRNIGTPLSVLSWNIVEWPEWGSWTFTPSAGQLTPEYGPVYVLVTVVAPNQQDESFSGEIMIVNIENSSDFEIIPVSMSTPKIQISSAPANINKIQYYKQLLNLIL